MADEHFHISKQITWGHIVTTASMMLAIVLGWADMDKRLTVAETRQANQPMVDARQDKRVDDVKKDIDKKLESMDKKLDRLIERR